MNILIAYTTRHGCAEKAAQLLKDRLAGNTTLVNLKKNGKPDLEGFDTIIIGGSIHIGKVQSQVRKFIEKNSDTLLKKRIGLYLCCMEENAAQRQFDDAFPEDLRQCAKATGIFGGEFNLERMNFLERKIVQKVAGVTESVFKINEAEIERFAETISKS